MNWWYFLVGSLRRFVPRSWLFTIMRWRGDGSLAESFPAKYAMDNWRERLAQHQLSIDGKRILEIGSGRYARQAVYWIAAGAQAVALIDLYAAPLSHVPHRRMLEKDCALLGLHLDDVLPRIQVIQGDFTRLAYSDTARQFDLVLSSSVLEHVYDPQLVFTACWHWLKPGGATYHMIDLRDHNLSFRYPFEMLTFSDNVWNRWLDLRAGFHLNRWRLPHYLSAMHQVGFRSVHSEPAACDMAGLHAVYPRLQPQYREFDPAALSVLTLYLYGEKPGVA